MASAQSSPSNRYLDMSEREAAERVLEMTAGMYLTHCLYTVCDLRVPDIVLNCDKPVSVEYIIQQIPQNINVEILRRVMRYVAANGVFYETCTHDGKLCFGATKITANLSSTNPSSGSNRVWMSGRPELGMALSNMHRLVKCELEPGTVLFTETHKKSFWDSLGESKTDHEKFQLTLKLSISGVIPSLVAEVKNSSRVVVDVGGGSGAVMERLREECPEVTCINFDLPDVIERCSSHCSIDMVAGDMFEKSSIPKCDTIFMRYILHDWKDEQCMEILRNCYEALPSHGKLICVEVLLPEHGKVDPFTKDSFQVDIMMLINFGSRERTPSEVKALFRSSGYHIEKTLPVGRGSLVDWPFIMYVARKVS